MRRVLFIVNADKPDAAVLAQRAAHFLEGKAEVLPLATDPHADLSSFSADIAVIFGGDGTVLNAFWRLGTTPPPLLTINLGRLGYLAETSPSQIEEMLTEVLEGRCRVSERMCLEVQILSRTSEVTWRGVVVNECAVLSAQPGRMARIEVAVDGRFLTRYGGDGIIIATPTGSTAYALSAGGPILNPELRASVLVPVSPHHLAHRPLVLGEEERLTIRSCGEQAVMLMGDGRPIRTLAEEERIEVFRSPTTLRLLLGQHTKRYDILRAKLGWGGR